MGQCLSVVSLSAVLLASHGTIRCCVLTLDPLLVEGEEGVMAALLAGR